MPVKGFFFSFILGVYFLRFIPWNFISPAFWDKPGCFCKEGILPAFELHGHCRQRNYLSDFSEPSLFTWHQLHQRRKFFASHKHLSLLPFLTSFQYFFYLTSKARVSSCVSWDLKTLDLKTEDFSLCLAMFICIFLRHCWATWQWSGVKEGVKEWRVGTRMYLETCTTSDTNTLVTGVWLF